MNSSFTTFYEYIKTISIEEIVTENGILILQKYKLAFLFLDEKLIEDTTSKSNYFLDLINNYQSRKIQLIVISDTQWINKQAITKSRINHLFEKSNTIHGRKTKCLRIDKQKAEDFLNQNHLNGYVSSKIKYGLFLEHSLVAVATFSAGRKMNNKPANYRSFELIRFATKNGYNVIGGLSKILKQFVADRAVGDIMTYIDRTWGTGNAFEKIGFEKKGELAPMQLGNYWNAGSLKMVLEIEKII